MIELRIEQFEQLVRIAIDHIPEQYGKRISNVAFVVEDEPDEHQRTKLKLRSDQSLYGLYEGVPLTKRGSGYNLVVPDKITVFRLPILASSMTMQDVENRVYETVWHEVAHYFGLDHERIHKLQSKK